MHITSNDGGLASAEISNDQNLVKVLSWFTLEYGEIESVNMLLYVECCVCLIFIPLYKKKCTVKKV